jgi:hypothetical protein
MLYENTMDDYYSSGTATNRASNTGRPPNKGRGALGDCFAG